jgi:hypothetical protein
MEACGTDAKLTGFTVLGSPRCADAIVRNLTITVFILTIAAHLDAGQYVL